MCISLLIPRVLIWRRIVGKGMHSQDHIAKLKPEIERLCQQHQFKYYVEGNDGRIVVKFGQGAGQLSQGEAASYWDNRPNYAPSQGYPGPSKPQGQQDQQYQVFANQGKQNDMVEQLVEETAPVVMKKLGGCCIIM